MINDELIKKAKAAYINKRHKTCSHDSLIAALEAVVPDILSEGWRRGAHDLDIDSAYTFEERDRMNPYERNEHA